MKAVVIREHGTLRWEEVADPELRPGQVIVKVRSAGVNRADLLQAAGKYPPPVTRSSSMLSASLTS